MSPLAALVLLVMLYFIVALVDKVLGNSWEDDD